MNGISLAWIGIGLCVDGWLIGLLVEIGPVVHVLPEHGVVLFV